MPFITALGKRMQVTDFKARLIYRAKFRASRRYVMRLWQMFKAHHKLQGGVSSSTSIIFLTDATSTRQRHLRKKEDLSGLMSSRQERWGCAAPHSGSGSWAGQGVWGCLPYLSITGNRMLRPEASWVMNPKILILAIHFLHLLEIPQTPTIAATAGDHLFKYMYTEDILNSKAIQVTSYFYSIIPKLPNPTQYLCP